jgi:hypothetical protein
MWLNVVVVVWCFNALVDEVFVRRVYRYGQD